MITEKNNINNTVNEEELYAAFVRRNLERLKPDIRLDNRMVVKTPGGKVYEGSARICEIMTVLKYAKALYNLEVPSEIAISEAVSARAAQLGISKSAIWDKTSRQLGITGKGAIERARALLCEAVESRNPRTDDLLFILRDLYLTRKDDADEFTDAYCSL